MASGPVITLFGAAGEVTGSCTLIETAKSRVVVDLGMIQGSAEDELRNSTLPDLDWATVDALIVTHAHIDHCGRLPMLAMTGFRGVIWATEATAGLLPKVLRGSASLQQVRRHEWRTGGAPVAYPIFPGEPLDRPKVEEPEPPILFVNSHVSKTMQLVQPLAWNMRQRISADVSLRLLNAGHVLGAASVELTCGHGVEECVVVCSGDLGPMENELHEPPASPRRADLVVMESTNGVRPKGERPDPEGQLERIFREAAPRGERLLIPTFAIGRAQQIILRLARLSRRGALGGLPVYLDATMAVRVTDRFREHLEHLAPEVRAAFERGEEPMEFRELHRLTTRTQSMALEDLRHGGIILAGAGFCDAGPILRHLAAGLDREDCRLILAGYHPADGIGDGLRRGAKLVHINGATIEVKAKVEEIEGLSGHGGQEDLLAWLGGATPHPAKVLLNHGSEEARAALAEAIHRRLGIEVVRSLSGERVHL